MPAIKYLCLLALTIPEEMPSLSVAQLDTVLCEASSTMVAETQSLSSQSSQGTDNILSGREGETDTMSSQSSQSTLPEKEISIWLDEKDPV